MVMHARAISFCHRCHAVSERDTGKDRISTARERAARSVPAHNHTKTTRLRQPQRRFLQVLQGPPACGRCMLCTSTWTFSC